MAHPISPALAALSIQCASRPTTTSPRTADRSSTRGPSSIDRRTRVEKRRGLGACLLRSPSSALHPVRMSAARALCVDGVEASSSVGGRLDVASLSIMRRRSRLCLSRCRDQYQVKRGRCRGDRRTPRQLLIDDSVAAGTPTRSRAKDPTKDAFGAASLPCLARARLSCRPAAPPDAADRDPIPGHPRRCRGVGRVK